MSKQSKYCTNNDYLKYSYTNLINNSHYYNIGDNSINNNNNNTNDSNNNNTSNSNNNADDNNYDINNPKWWGPYFWYTLHNGSSKYPKQASPIVRKRMKHFILGLPFMIPCEKCKDHAITYIDSKYDELDTIVDGKKNLFTFFWKFHNEVNKRNGKPEFCFGKACEIYKF